MKLDRNKVVRQTENARAARFWASVVASLRVHPLFKFLVRFWLVERILGLSSRVSLMCASNIYVEALALLVSAARSFAVS
jgi:hypothetical protein